MSKAYIKGYEEKGHEIHIKLLDCGPRGKARLAIRTNADEGQLATPPNGMAWEQILAVDDVLTIVIED